MKKIKLMTTTAAILAFTVTSFAAQAYSPKPEMNAKSSISLEMYFRGASDVKWYPVTARRIEATFNIKNDRETAYFDEHGHLLLASRSIKVSDLPIQVSLEMTSQFPQSAVRYAREYTSDGSTMYILTLESLKDWKTVKVRDNRDITVIRDIRKIYIH
ncbi:MAG TPA: hypothetical protein VNE41_03140 [Chitinophagaceae bacterium]|nr:hypothetical protein [Chitinophagaceae bacterium]